MKLWLHKIELAVDRLIVPAVFVILFMLLAELFHISFAEKYEKVFFLADTAVVNLFILDLIFKYYRVRNVKDFIKRYWIDILAIFPFYLVFRIFESFGAFRALETITEGQMYLHESLEIEREVGKAHFLGRSYQIRKWLKVLRHVPRLLKIIPYFERPNGNHHHLH